MFDHDLFLPPVCLVFTNLSLILQIVQNTLVKLMMLQITEHTRAAGRMTSVAHTASHTNFGMHKFSQLSSLIIVWFLAEVRLFLICTLKKLAKSKSFSILTLIFREKQVGSSNTRKCHKPRLETVEEEMPATQPDSLIKSRAAVITWYSMVLWHQKYHDEIDASEQCLQE